MDTTHDTRQRVYLHARPIFSGDFAQLRQKKKVRKLVLAHRATLNPLVQELGEPTLVTILRELLEDRIFESDIRAKAEFPALFNSTLVRDAEHEASEIDAAQSTKDALEGAVSDGEESSDDEEVPPLPNGVEEKKDKPKTHEQYQLPSLYPSYLPYKTQHLLLTTAQQTLEECCFDFAKKWQIEVLLSHGWDDPTAVELTKWSKVIGKCDSTLPPEAMDLGGANLKKLLTSTHKIRHTAVHRVPTTARGISELLQHAVKLAEVLRDQPRASRLGSLKSELDSKIKAMEMHKNVLENNTANQLVEFRRQRKELERLERELLANTIKEDLSNKALIGNLLEKTVGHIFSQGGDRSEHLDCKVADDDSVSDESDGEVPPPDEQDVEPEVELLSAVNGA